MARAIDVHEIVFKNSAPTELDRVVGADGTNITQTDITSGVYSIYLLDEQDPDSRTAVTGHSAAALVVADVIFDALQLDDRWDKDAIGYNFRHTIDISSNQAFAVAGRTYLVEYTLTPSGAGEQPIILRFQHQVI